MDIEERLIAEASAQYLRLLDEANSLLRNLDRTSPTQMAEKLRVRQNIIGLLQKFDQPLERTPAESGDPLAKFRAFQDKTTRQILEADGLVIALIREKQTAIKIRLASFKTSKIVFQAYQSRAPRTQRPLLNEQM